MARVDLFTSVVLDFKNVPTIGQGFADEIFRIFVREHPHIDVLPVNANSEVRRMIMRAQSEALVGESANPSPSPSSDEDAS